MSEYLGLEMIIIAVIAINILQMSMPICIFLTWYETRINVGKDETETTYSPKMMFCLFHWKNYGRISTKGRVLVSFL
jgi:hypothetical protein